MVRKMAYVGSSYLIGLFFASFLNYKADFIFAVGISLIAVSFFVLIDSKRTYITVCMLTISAALAFYGAYEAFVYYPILGYSGQVVTIKGEINDIRYFSDDKTGYIIKGRLNDKSGYFSLYCNMLDCDYFDYISVRGVVDKFEDTYIFPYESFNKSQSVFLEMTEPEDIEITSNFSVRREILHYRDYLCDRITSFLPNEEGTALTAMLCGDKTGFDNDTKTILFRSGIGHVMSVSGAHLAIISGLIIWLIKGFGFNKWIRFGILEIILICFVTFAGFSETVLRSVIMITIVYGAGLFKRRPDNFNSLGISIIILSATEPFLVRNASFMLSVAGVFGIGVAAPMITSDIKISGLKGKIIKYFLAMFCVAVVVFPVSFMFFDEISVVSPVTNMLLFPFCTVALICGVLAALTRGIGLIAFPLLMIAGLCCKAVLGVSRFVGGLSFTYIPAGFNYIQICICVSIIAVILSYLIFKKKSAVVLTACFSIAGLILCSISYQIINMGTLSIAVIGDINGSSLILHKGSDACIIDLNGGRKNARMNQKYLRKSGIENIKVLALTSDTLQSIPAYEKRFQLFETEQILIPDEEYYLNNLQILGVTPKKINADDTEIDMGSYQVYISSDNTVRVTYGDFTMLCASGKSEVDHSRETYSVSAFYDGLAAPVSSGYIITLNDHERLSNVITGSALITCNENGETRVRRITNGSRQ